MFGFVKVQRGTFFTQKNKIQRGTLKLEGCRVPVGAAAGRQHYVYPVGCGHSKLNDLQMEGLSLRSVGVSI